MNEGWNSKDILNQWFPNFSNYFAWRSPTPHFLKAGFPAGIGILDDCSTLTENTYKQ